MDGELQRTVDAVAARVGRPALIEDRRQRVVVYSEHTEPMDAVRRASILRRHTTPEVIAWFRGAGILEARDPVRTPACPELGLLPRVCLPVRHDDLLLGFVWFIDADGTMSDDDIRAARDTMSDLSLALYRENLLGELISQRETEAARALLSEAPASRAYAVRALLEEGLIWADGPTTALVGHLAMAEGEAPDEITRMAVEQALVLTRRWLGPKAALHLPRHDHGVLLLCGARGAGRPAAETVAGHLDDALRAATRGLTAVAGTAVGIGQQYPSLVEGARSYAEALHASRVAFRLPALGRVLDWSRLGVYRVLSNVDSETSVHSGMEILLRDEANQVLLETLETYLDLAGNAHATAERLRLHRTTLYYRLQRIEQLAGTDLKDGNERLCLHLALKLARLTGAWAGAR